MQDPSEPRVCAAVVLYKPDPHHLARLAAGLDGVQLLAFANGPLDEDARATLAAAGAEVAASPANLGLGAGLNAVTARGAAQGYSHVLLLDQDSEPPPGLVAALLARAGEGQHAHVAVVAPRLVPPQGEGYKSIRYAWRASPAPLGLRAVDFAPTSGSLMSLQAFAEVGPFLEDFFIAGLDVEWGFRAWSRGWGSYVAEDVVMPHRWGEPVKPGEGEVPQILRHVPVRNYYYARNVLATARLPHVPWRWRLASCATLAAQVGLLALKGAPGALRPVRMGVADALAGRMGAAPQALVERREE